MRRRLDDACDRRVVNGQHERAGTPHRDHVLDRLGFRSDGASPPSSVITLLGPEVGRTDTLLTRRALPSPARSCTTTQPTSAHSASPAPASSSARASTCGRGLSSRSRRGRGGCRLVLVWGPSHLSVYLFTFFELRSPSRDARLLALDVVGRQSTTKTSANVPRQTNPRMLPSSRRTSLFLRSRSLSSLDVSLFAFQVLLLDAAVHQPACTLLDHFPRFDFAPPGDSARLSLVVESTTHRWTTRLHHQQLDSRCRPPRATPV